MLRWSRLKPSCTWPLVWLASTADCRSRLATPEAERAALCGRPVDATARRAHTRQQLRISAEASRKILEHLRSNPELEGDVFLRGSGLVASFLSEQLIPGYSNPLLWRLDTAALQRALAAGNDRLVLSVSRRDGAVGGWQRASPASREVSPKLVANGQEYWPSPELRLVNRAPNTTVFLGY
jgi:hypothetical protein